MGELLQQIWVHVQDNGVKIVVGLLFMGFGWWIGHRRARRAWTRREFYDRLNFSLNWIENGTLRFRTLAEKRCEDVFLNSVAAEAVRVAAGKTTEANPVLPLPKTDYWYYLNSLLNELSEQFAEGLLRQEMGQPCSTASYLVCLTSECAGDLRTRKVRVMVIRQSLLENLPTERPKLEGTRHGTRWDTLKVLATRFKNNPEEFIEVQFSIAK